MAQRTAPTLPDPIPETDRGHGWKTIAVRILARAKPRATASELRQLFIDLYPGVDISHGVIVHGMKTKDKADKAPRVSEKPTAASDGRKRARKGRKSSTERSAATSEPGAIAGHADGPEPTVGELRRVWQYLRERKLAAADVAGLFGLGISVEAVGTAVGMVAEMQEATK